MSETRNRWIMYSHQGFPGDMFPRVTCHESLEWCKASLWRFSRETGAYEQASATLYPFTAEDWQQARNFEDVGCPFDYPSKVIEFGPRGGLVVQNA